MLATKPVTIDGIAFDALIEEEISYEAESPDYPTEEGFCVHDTIILKPLTLSMTLVVSDTPVTWSNIGHGGTGWVDKVISRLEALYFEKKPVTVITSKKVYSNMAIQSFTISKSKEDGFARHIPISFKQIRQTKAKTVAIPASYGKSGATAQNAGTASTTTKKVAVSPTNSSTKSNQQGNSKKGSIAYNLAKKAGIIKGKK